MRVCSVSYNESTVFLPFCKQQNSIGHTLRLNQKIQCQSSHTAARRSQNIVNYVLQSAITQYLTVKLNQPTNRSPLLKYCNAEDLSAMFHIRFVKIQTSQLELVAI